MITAKRIEVYLPARWENKRGIRVFFDHGENILDDFANRNNRPVREYNKIIREQVIQKIESKTGPKLKIARIVPIPNQQPCLEANTDWLPRTSYTIRLANYRIPSYNMDYEIIVRVEEI